MRTSRLSRIGPQPPLPPFRLRFLRSRERPTLFPRAANLPRYDECIGREFPSGSNCACRAVPRVVRGKWNVLNRRRNCRTQRGAYRQLDIAPRRCGPETGYRTPSERVSSSRLNGSIVLWVRYGRKCGNPACSSLCLTTRSEITQSAAADPIPYPTNPATIANIQPPLTFRMVRQLTAANPMHNPSAAANTRLGRESSKFARHDAHCKFSVRTSTRSRGTFPKHNGQARFHIVVKFVRFSLGLQPAPPRAVSR